MNKMNMPNIPQVHCPVIIILRNWVSYYINLISSNQKKEDFIL
jgi:hypothetical protein